MIRAEFRRDSRGPLSLDIRGHAGFAQSGSDIVCAGVTSAVQLTADGITEVVGCGADVTVEEDCIHITLLGDIPPAAFQMMEALYLHLEILREQYPQNIQITASEV